MESVVDSMEIIFWILILLAPVVSRILKKRKGARKLPTQPQPLPDRPQPLPDRNAERRIPVHEPTTERELTPFEEALRQIQDALADSRDARDQQTEPAGVGPPAPTVSAQGRQPVERPGAPGTSSMTLFERADSGKPHPSRPVKPQIGKKAFRETSYDDAFEATVPYGESFHESVHSHVPSTPDESRKPKAKPARSKWQQAYVMSEILNAPRSRTPWRSRMTR